MARTKYTVTFPAAKAGDEVTWPNSVKVYADANIDRPLGNGYIETAAGSFTGWSDAASVTFTRAGTSDSVTVTTGSPTGTGAAVPSAASSVAVKDEGSTVVATASALNFVGAGVTASDGGSGTATVTIPGASTAPSAYTNGSTYAVGQTATYNGVTIYATAAHTASTATPDTTKWQVLGFGAGVYHVSLYGAKVDGRRVYDAVTTGSSATVTSATAAFTSADIGKSILIQQSNGTVLYNGTVSAVGSGTSITLGGTATGSTTGSTLTLGTDDTPAWIAATTAMVTAGGGAVVCPFIGISVWAGAQQSQTVTGAALGGGNYVASGQVLIPAQSLLLPQQTLEFRGAVPAPQAVWASVTGDDQIQELGTEICSFAVSGNVVDVVPESTARVSGTIYMSNNLPIFRNLIVKTPNNTQAGGLRLRKAVGARVLDSTVGVNAKVLQLNASTGAGVGVEMPEFGNGTDSEMRGSQVYGYPTGVTHSEHFRGDNLMVALCGIGLAPYGGTNSHLVKYDRVGVQWCGKGIQPSSRINVVGDLQFESKSAPNGPTVTIDINDASNVLFGQVRYTCTDSAGTGSVVVVGCNNLDLYRVDLNVSSKRALATNVTFTHATTTTGMPQAESGQIWTATGGSVWGISSNKAKMTSGAGRSTLLLTPHSLITATAFTIQADITLGASNPIAGFLINGTDGSNGLLIGLENDATPNTLFINKEVAGVQTSLTSGAVTLVNGNTYTLKVVRTATTVTAFVGGTQIATYTLITGEQTIFNAVNTHGLLAYETTSAWDNFSIV